MVVGEVGVDDIDMLLATSRKKSSMYCRLLGSYWDGYNMSDKYIAGLERRERIECIEVEMDA